MIKLKSLFIVLFATLFLMSCEKKKEISKGSSTPPNVIFIIADDMYPEMFNCLPEGKGKNYTPNLDRIAKEGVLLSNQFVASPVCTPSRYNCLTGCYASRATNRSFVDFTKKQEGQTVIHWNSFITPNDQALPHYLQELGYKTGMVGKNHVMEAKDLYSFPDYWSDPKAPEIKAKVEENYKKSVQAVLSCGFDYAGAVYHDNPNFVGLGHLAVQNMDWITKAGVDFIDQNKDNPFFLYFATTIPHHPTEPERSWNANPQITANGFLNQILDVLPARATIPERTKAAGLKGKGKENLLWLDDAIGALFTKLEQLNIDDNTIIFFFNDHGQKAKGSLYQGGVMTPSLVWKKGGFKCGHECNAKVQNIDFAPTILEIAGKKAAKDQFDGESFYSVLNNKKEKAKKERTMFFELGFARAIIKGDYKYYAIRYPDYAKNRSIEEKAEVLEAYNAPRRIKKMGLANPDDPTAPYSHFSVIPGGQLAEHESYGKLPGYFDLDQLYNLNEDPNEMHNLVANKKYEAKLAELKMELRNHLAQMPGKFDL